MVNEPSHFNHKWHRLHQKPSSSITATTGNRVDKSPKEAGLDLGSKSSHAVWQYPIWLFDLDNTLYPPEAGLMDAISDRINLFITRHLNLPSATAEGMREAYYGSYGSSVLGVLKHCRVDAEELLSFIHDLPVDDYLSPEPQIAALLRALPGRKSIFTNATAEYARRVLLVLGLEDQFERIFDIRFSRFESKPAPTPYGKVMGILNHSHAACWFVEDTLANLRTAKLFGCRTVWITPAGEAAPGFVDFAISHLAQLQSIVEQARGTTSKTVSVE